MTPAEYLTESQKISDKITEYSWFRTEVSFFAISGRLLDVLKDKLTLGSGINKEEFIENLGHLLWNLCEMSVNSSLSYVFSNSGWENTRSIVPGGYNGCANALIAMIKSQDIERKLQFFSVACSHLGVTWEQVSSQNILSIRKSFPKIYGKQ